MAVIKNRRPIEIIDKALLDRIRQADFCDICQGLRPAGGDYHPHHLIRRGSGGGSRIDHERAILATCPHCHHQIHNGSIPKWAVLCCAAAKFQTTPQQVQEFLWKLQRGEC